MVIHDRIRLTGLLRKAPVNAGAFYLRPGTAEGPESPSAAAAVVLGYCTVNAAETDSVVTTGNAYVPGTISLRFGSE